ncbi:MAG: hypothetical protein ACP5E3_17795, partial [Bacteroidales bacterium]
MKKIRILLFFTFFLFPLFGQQENIRVVLLGASHAYNCEFNIESPFSLLNHSVADFTSGQLLWTIEHG